MSDAIRVHLFDDAGGIAIWLDTEIAEHDGLCIGLGKTRPLAINDALLELRAAVRVLEAAEYDMGRAIAAATAAVPGTRAAVVAAVTHIVDAWIRDGGGTYDELEAIIAAAVEGPIRERGGG
jgi:hypothetical protein